MQKRKTDEKGFTLIEVIVTLVLVGITAVLAGMWIVSVANGYIFAKMNASTVQKAQLAMTRLEKEFVAISSVDLPATNATNGQGITYKRANEIAILGQIDGIVTTSTSGKELQLNGSTLTDSVFAFKLAYCDNPTSTSCPLIWSSTSRIIEITLTLTGASGVQSTFTSRVAPRNL